MTAPELSTEEVARVAEFEAAPDAEESIRERLARAIAAAQDAHGPFYFPCKCGWDAGFGAGWEDRGEAHELRCQADAALAVLAPPATERTTP